MRRHHDNAPPRHAASPRRTWRAGDGTERPPASGGIVAVSLVLISGSPALGTALALLRGPWILMLVLLHVGGLALWFGLSGRGWRDLLTGGGIRSRTVLFAAGALGGVAFGGLHTWMGPTGTGPLWKPEITASTVLHALVFALTVGVVYNAVPEEITLRRTLFSPIHERFGATAADGVLHRPASADLADLRHQPQGLCLADPSQGALRAARRLVGGAASVDVLRPGPARQRKRAGTVHRPAPEREPARLRDLVAQRGDPAHRRSRGRRPHPPPGPAARASPCAQSLIVRISLPSTRLGAKAGYMTRA